MQKVNITTDELKILRCYKKPNIRIIRHLLHYYSADKIQLLCAFISIDKLLEYEKTIPTFTVSIVFI